MSNGSGRQDARLHASEKAPSASSGGERPPKQEPVRLKSPQSLERLRDRVKKAAHELERLRKENTALAERIRQLETRPAVDFDGTVLAFDEDPEALREKVESFIRSIDTYLAKEEEA